MIVQQPLGANPVPPEGQQVVYVAPPQVPQQVQVQPVPVNVTVTVQPEAVRAENLMPQPPVPANCPPGLEYLTQLGQLLVKQKVEMFEAITGWETVNKVFK